MTSNPEIMQTAAAPVFAGSRSDETDAKADAGHSLHFGLSAPPSASQAFDPGVAKETHDML